MSSGETLSPALARAEGPIAADACWFNGETVALEEQAERPPRAAGSVGAPAAAASAANAVASAEG